MEKTDKQFMIQFDQRNRDFLTSVALYTLSSLMSVSALLVAVFSLIYSLNGLTIYTIIVAAVFIIVGGLYWLIALPNAKRDLKNAKKINKQLQDALLEAYPEYKSRYY